MHHKAISLVCFLFLFNLALSAQDEKKSKRYEDYKSKLTQQDPSDLLLQAQQLKRSSPAQALDKVQEALGFSLAGKDQFNEGKCYLVLGEINESVEEWKLAME